MKKVFSFKKKNEKTKDKNKTTKKIGLKKIALIVILVAVVIYAIILTLGLKMQYTEYKEIGENFTDIFWTNLKTQLICGAIGFVAIFIIFYITNIFIKIGLKKICEKENAKYPKLPNKTITVIIALLGSIAFARYSFSTVLSCINATWFNISDPIFNKNVSYFIFQRPFYMMLIESISTLLVGLIVYTIAYYIVAISMLLSEGIDKNTLKESSFIPHTFINVMLFLIVRALGFNIQVEGLVFSRFLESTQGNENTFLVGAGYISANILRYFYTVLPYITILCIIISAIFIRRKKYKKTIIAIAIIPAVMLLAGIVTTIYNVFVVSPNELEYEKKYIEYNMEYTKKGYNLDIDEESYEITNDITQEVIENNKQTVDNIRILDYNSTLKVLNQYQTIKGYYKFNDTDIAVYNVNGQKQALFVSARELDSNSLKSKNYINRTYQYTHGYGVTINTLNSVDENGYPNFVIKDISQNISNQDILINEPRIYYGELTDNYVVVNGKGIKEFDYPTNNKQEEYEYEYNGQGGINLTTGNRILMAIKNIDPKLLYSQYIDKDSKILINRNIIDRAEKIAPFLEYDKDPYLVITDAGKLVWIIDGYTTTDNYPYSQVTEIMKKYDNGIPYKKEFNYIRNSVKVVIDAYDGTTKFYIVDKDDPIIMSYYKMYPTMFESIDEGMPEDIWEHTRYPEYLYNIQSEILEKYHVNNVDVFYRNEDLWTVATHNNGTKEEDMAPYYGLTTIDGKLEFALMQQYTPYNRKNLISWTAVKSNKDEYGKIKIFTFDKDSNVVGPMQLDNQIDQNAEISQDLSLWSSSGSSVTRNMVLVPTGNTLIYVESIYLAAMNESQIPSIKKVVVSNGNNLAIADTLQQALDKIVNKEVITITVENNETVEEIVQTLIQTNRSMKEVAATSNWEAYGTYMQKQDDLIKQLEELQKKDEELKQ